MLASIWSAMRGEAGATTFDATVAALTADGPTLPAWPYPGPVVMTSTRREREWHVFHDWRHLGTVTDETEIAVVATRTATFSLAVYRRIVEAVSRPDVEIRPL